MKALIGVAACLFPLSCFAQTKLISFRSHSGSNANFRTAVEHNLFDIGHSNFGIVGTSVTKVDSVILKGNNKMIIMRKSYYVVGNKSYNPVFMKDTLTKAKAGELFTANNMDDLKADIHKMYKTAKLDSSTLFIGFNKKFNLRKVK